MLAVDEVDGGATSTRCTRNLCVGPGCAAIDRPEDRERRRRAGCPVADGPAMRSIEKKGRAAPDGSGEGRGDIPPVAAAVMGCQQRLGVGAQATSTQAGEVGKHHPVARVKKVDRGDVVKWLKPNRGSLWFGRWCRACGCDRPCTGRDNHCHYEERHGQCADHRSSALADLRSRWSTWLIRLQPALAVIARPTILGHSCSMILQNIAREDARG